VLLFQFIKSSVLSHPTIPPTSITLLTYPSLIFTLCSCNCDGPDVLRNCACHGVRFSLIVADPEGLHPFWYALLLRAAEQDQMANFEHLLTPLLSKHAYSYVRKDFPISNFSIERCKKFLCRRSPSARRYTSMFILNPHAFSTLMICAFLYR